MAGWYTDYNVHSRQSAYGTSFAYNVLFGAEIAGGDLQIGADGSEQSRLQQHRFRWRRVWDESKPVGQVIVGRHSTEGLIAVQIDGITITNKRPAPRTLFGRELVQGYAAPGTEVEAYVGSDLVGLAYVEDSGRFGLPVPVAYGSTSIELRYFNRYGLVADEHRFLQIPTTLLPAGESEYSFQVGRRYLSFSYRVTWRTDRHYLWTQRGPRYGPRVTGLNWTIDLSALRTASVAAAQGAGSYSSQSANGSIVYDSEHGAARFSRLSQVGRSNATFQMFMDTDGNGRRDEGEPELETSGLRLVHANARLRSEHTASTARHLVGYARYTATVDRSRIANPLWISAVDSFSFVARPNVVSTYEIPVQVGGAIEGRLVAADQAIEPDVLDGINLTLTSADNGTARLIQTYSDGAFYEIGLRPGTYTVQIDPSELEGRRLTIVPASHSFRISHKGEGDFVRDLNFSVHFEAVDAGIAPADTVETPVLPDYGPAARPSVFETAATAIGDDSDDIAEGRPPVRHIVDSGESLARIALGHYGDRRYWIRLFRANQDIVADPHVLRTGWKLDVPPDSPLTDEELSDLAAYDRLKQGK